MSKKKGYVDYQDYIKVKDTEFNQMQLYLIRINNIMDRRDNAYEEGLTLNFYRSTMNLYSNVVAKLEMEQVKGLKEYINKLKELGIHIRNTYTTIRDDKLREKNLLLAEQKLLDLNTELNRLIMSSGLIFPKGDYKTAGQLRELDYDE